MTETTKIDAREEMLQAIRPPAPGRW